MFFFLSKTLNFFIKPFNILIILLVVSFFIKNTKWKKRLRIVTVVLFLFFSNGLIVNQFFLWWEKPAVPMDQLEACYDIAVVLGGTADVNRKPSDRLFFHKGADRITHAIELYKAGKIDKILYTGGRARLFEDPEVDNSPIYNFYVKCGVHPDDILIENVSQNTHENALFVKNLFEERGIDDAKVLLITSAFHMRRSEACFRKVGLDVTGFSTDFYSPLPKDEFSFSQLFPSSLAFTGWDILIKEWVGLVMYWLMGYV